MRPDHAFGSYPLSFVAILACRSAMSCVFSANAASSVLSPSTFPRRASPPGARDAGARRRGNSCFAGCPALRTRRCIRSPRPATAARHAVDDAIARSWRISCWRSTSSTPAARSARSAALSVAQPQINRRMSACARACAAPLDQDHHLGFLRQQRRRWVQHGRVLGRIGGEAGAWTMAASPGAVTCRDWPDTRSACARGRRACSTRHNMVLPVPVSPVTLRMPSSVPRRTAAPPDGAAPAPSKMSAGVMQAVGSRNPKKVQYMITPMCRRSGSACGCTRWFGAHPAGAQPGSGCPVRTTRLRRRRAPSRPASGQVDALVRSRCACGLGRQRRRPRPPPSAGGSISCPSDGRDR